MASAKRKDGARWRSRLTQAVSALGALVVLGAVIAGGVWGLGPLRDRTRERLTRSLDTVQVVIAWPLDEPSLSGGEVTTWVPPSVQEELTAKVHEALLAEPDPLSSAGLRKAGESLIETAWLSSIESVRRVGSEVRIQGTWRVPWAVVRWRGRDQLVSREGVVLPMSFEAGASGFRVIEGLGREPALLASAASVHEGWPPRPRHGVVWPGEDLQAALDLLETLVPHAWWSQVAGVDAARYAAEKSLVILTTPGASASPSIGETPTAGRIVWGAGPKDFVPWEQSTEVKIRRLNHLAQSRGRIDGGEQTVYIAGERILIDQSPVIATLPGAERGSP